MINTQTRVVLPGWCLRGADQEEIKQNVLKYINPKRYPGYRVLKVSKGFAICEREM
ncbi:hypothetical protein ICY_05293 [Bacillus cereus BAG2X1-3]|nr:hypothetical protein ICY_05293 [Bacillus cereus BAG2X1-3]